MLLSLDVGFRSTGWVLFHDGKIVNMGVVQTEKTQRKDVLVADDNMKRIIIITKKINSLMEEYDPKGMLGELPHGGSQNAQAAHQMGIAKGIIGAIQTLWDVPAEWCTPRELKKVVTGRPNASKDEIMDVISSMYQWDTYQKGKGIFFRTPVGDFLKGEFEHIADAIGAYEVLRITGNLVKLFG